MANTKISELAALTGLSISDLITVLDVSDTSMSGAGTNKQATLQALGDLLVPTTVYKQGSTDVAVADGGTGASTADAARTNLGVPAVVSLTSDATAVIGTSFANAATGLNLAATNGVPLNFRFSLAWVANATTTGAAFALNGPAATRLWYRVIHNTDAAATSWSGIQTAYDAGSAVGTASGATNNFAIVEGILVPSADGTLALRSKAEVASPGSVTVKAGSSVMYW